MDASGGNRRLALIVMTVLIVAGAADLLYEWAAKSRSPAVRDRALSQAGRAQIGAEDLAAAQSTAAGIQDPAIRNGLLVALIRAQIRRGDIASAVETAGLLKQDVRASGAALLIAQD